MNKLLLAGIVAGSLGLATQWALAGEVTNGTPVKVMLIEGMPPSLETERTHRGALEAAKELANPEALAYWGPQGETCLSSEQLNEIKDAVAHHVDAIVWNGFACKSVLEIVQSFAHAGGKVVNYFGRRSATEQDVFIDEGSYEFSAIGKLLADLALKVLGDDGGRFAIMAYSPKDPSIDAMRHLLEIDPKYSKLKEVDAVYFNKDSAVADSKAAVDLVVKPVKPLNKSDADLHGEAAVDLVKKHPDIRLILSADTFSTEGAAAAMDRAGMCGKVKVAGIGSPSSLAPYTRNDCVPAFANTNDVDLGYLMYYTAYALATKALDAKKNASFTAGRLGEQVIVAKPGDDEGLRIVGTYTIYDKSNIEAAVK